MTGYGNIFIIHTPLSSPPFSQFWGKMKSSWGKTIAYLANISYLCTGNRRKRLMCLITGISYDRGGGINDGRRWSSMKTWNRGTERGAFRVVVIQRTLKHRTEYEVYEDGNLENGDFISGHFRSWSFSTSVIFIVYYFFAAFLYKSMKFFYHTGL